jgi:hypothetical protein
MFRGFFMQPGETTSSWLASLIGMFAKLSWIGRAMTIGLAGAISFAAQDVIRNPDEVANRVGQFQAYQRLGSSEPGQLPLSTEARLNLDRMIDQISGDITYKLDNANWNEVQGMVPWTIAQMTVASAGLAKLNTGTIERYVINQMDPTCGCWRELADKPEHIAASGWVLYGLGRANLALPEPAIDFLLTNQSPDGWWPIYPAQANDRHASTYATGWALLALDEHLARSKAGLVPERKGVADAIQRGVRWLKRTRATDEARWYDYPSYHTKVRAVGLSGFTLYVLHRFSRPDELLPVDRIWMRKLDTQILNAEETDSSDGYVMRINGQMAIDATRHIRLPWNIVGTVKSFKGGTRWEQARAVAWIERVLRRDLLSESVMARGWVTSELLIALRELKAVLAVEKR